MRPAPCNLCGAMKKSALAKCPCVPARPETLAASPELAMAARVFLDLDVNRPESDALVHRHPLLVVVGAAVGLFAWRQCGAPWPEDGHAQQLIVCTMLALVMGILGIVLGPDRLAQHLERLKRMDVGLMSVPLVLGAIAVAALLRAP